MKKPSGYGVVQLAIEFAKAEAIDGKVEPAEFERYWRQAIAAYRQVELAIDAEFGA